MDGRLQGVIGSRGVGCVDVWFFLLCNSIATAITANITIMIVTNVMLVSIPGSASPFEVPEIVSRSCCTIIV